MICTFIDVDATVSSRVPPGTDAVITIDQVLANPPVFTGRVGTIIDVDFTLAPGIPLCACAREVADIVRAVARVHARFAGAVVDVDFTAGSTVTRVTQALVAVYLIYAETTVLTW